MPSLSKQKLADMLDVEYQRGERSGYAKGYEAGQAALRKDLGVQREHTRLDTLKAILRCAETAAEAASKAMMSYERQL
jgi:DNA-binding SARP family transcriptional activator